MPRIRTQRGTTQVVTEAQVKAAIKRSDVATTEMESSLTEIRELADQLNVARNEMTDRLAHLLNQPLQPGAAQTTGRKF